MPRGKSSFVCRECGYVSLGWLGRCPGCGGWNTIDEAAPQVSAFPRKAGRATAAPVPVRPAEVDAGAHTRIDTGLGELNRVLGGGLVAGCVVLLGGEAGVGSTLLRHGKETPRHEYPMVIVPGCKVADNHPFPE